MIKAFKWSRWYKQTENTSKQRVNTANREDSCVSRQNGIGRTPKVKERFHWNHFNELGRSRQSTWIFPNICRSHWSPPDLTDTDKEHPKIKPKNRRIRSIKTKTTWPRLSLPSSAVGKLRLFHVLALWDGCSLSERTSLACFSFFQLTLSECNHPFGLLDAVCALDPCLSISSNQTYIKMYIKMYIKYCFLSTKQEPSVGPSATH